MGEDAKDLPKVPMTSRSSKVVKTGSWRSSRPEIDEEKCIKCYICWKFCPDVAVIVTEGEYPEIDYVHCKGCGICAVECPKDCIGMKREVRG